MTFGLTDEQARATPTVSALSIGALIKHVTDCQQTWMLRVASAPDAPTADDRPMQERHAGHGDIIREGIDGATMYELLAGLEGWPETDWLTPFRPATAI